MKKTNMPQKEIEQLTDDPSLNIALDTIKIKKQALIFVNTKKSAEKTAEEIAKKLKTGDESLNELSEKALHAIAQPTKQCRRLSECLKKGIAFHHAGLHHKQKELIEENFREGAVKIICSTPTLCLSKDTLIWSGTTETAVSEFKKSNPIFVLSNNTLINMKAQKIQRIENSSKLIQISSVLGYSIKVTPNHKMLIKRSNKKEIMLAMNIMKGDRIATIGKLNIVKISTPCIKDFVIDNKIPISNEKFDSGSYYLIGAMLGDGYSGAETIDGRIKYKGNPAIVGKDGEIFSQIEEICKKLELTYRKSKSYNGTPQLVLGKNKWFREFLCRCGVEKRERKHISQKLMNGEFENVASLLRGLFDTDGYVEKSGNVGFSNTSKKLIEQIRKLLLRSGIVSRTRLREEGEMKIYGKTYRTLPHWELNIFHKKSIYAFYKKIGFSVKRKQNSLENIVKKFISNVHYVLCKACNYKVYGDLFGSRTKLSEEWGQNKIEIIRLLGERVELGSRELTKILGYPPRKKETRINHHYELISKRKIGSISNTEWFWSLNQIGRWIFENIIDKGKKINAFFENRRCPLCGNKLTFYIKKGWRASDFDGDIFWDIVKDVKVIDKESVVYDVVLTNSIKNDHMFVANGFIAHNSYGLDLPAFRSVLKDLKRYGHQGYQYIPVLEYLQMAGRAGRPKFDSFGEAICIASSEPEKEKIYEKFILGEPEEIFSKLAVEPVLRTYLLSLIASNLVKTKVQIMEFFEKTFWAFHFKDMEKLEAIISRMLGLLEEWKFIKSSAKDEFKSANALENESYDATLIGKRVAELYIDPLTAHHLITCLKNSGVVSVHSFSLLQVISHTLEMRPLLAVKTKEWDEVQEKLASYENSLLEKEPTLYEEEYDDYFDSVKTALFFEDWVNEKNEEYLLEQYNIRPGETRVKLNIADWLLYASEELSRILEIKPMLKEILKLRFRLKYGVKEELLPLMKLKHIGRVRGRMLFNNGIKDIADVKKADLMALTQIVGSNIAIDIKKQVGEDFEKMRVKENKRRGQISLGDY